jgi:hypothetical protein
VANAIAEAMTTITVRTADGEPLSFAGAGTDMRVLTRAPAVWSGAPSAE